MDKNTPLIGLKCVVIHRCSDEKQIKDMDQQRKATSHFIAKYQLIAVKEIEAPAVSASVKKHKKVIYELLAQKKRGTLDFDVLLFADHSRFTRTGRTDGHRMLSELADEEIMVVTVKDGLLVGKEGESRADQNLRDSEAYAEAVAYNTSKGVEDAMEKGEIPHCTIAPYGTDRCYTSDDGTPLFILRDCGPGEKAKLDPVTREVVKVLKHTVYDPAVIKQSDQKIVLVKGPPEEVKIINEVFARRYIDGWGSGRIVRELNERRVVTPSGLVPSDDRGWTRCTIEHIWRNWMYLGIGYANQATTGVYVKRSPNAPIELPERRTPGKRKDGMGQRENIQSIPRPWGEHLGIHYPDLTDLLEPHIRGIARQAIEQLRNKPKKPATKKRRYSQSSYLLTGVLRTKQFDLSMNGLPSKNQHGKQYRYYALHRVANSPGVNEKLTARLRADHVEQEVIAALSETLSDPNVVSAGVRDYIDSCVKRQRADGDPLPPLVNQKAQLEDEYRNLHHVYGKRGQELMAKRVAELERLLDDLDLKIKSASSSVSFAPLDVEAITESVRSQCSDVVGMLGDRSTSALKRVVETFVSKATFDLETREVEIEVGLPSWALSKENRVLDEVRPLPDLAAEKRRRTHIENRVFLTKYRCSHGRVSRSPCLTCSRLSKAA